MIRKGTCKLYLARIIRCTKYVVERGKEVDGKRMLDSDDEKPTKTEYNKVTEFAVEEIADCVPVFEVKKGLFVRYSDMNKLSVLFRLNTTDGIALLTKQGIIIRSDKITGEGQIRVDRDCCEQVPNAKQYKKNPLFYQNQYRKRKAEKMNEGIN